MERQIWDFLKEAGFNDFAIAGLMGNLYAESGLNPKNLENIYNTKLKYTDDAYTTAVDSGEYTDFVHDAAGYGLAQWTYWSRKQGLLNMARNLNTSIGNLDTQLNFLLNELKNNYTNSVYKVLLNASSVKEASDVVLYKFENPANAAAQSATRCSYANKFYNKYAKGVERPMGIQIYYKNQDVQLSENFYSHEFQCKCGKCSTIKIDDNLVEILQDIRDHCDSPVHINSAYRCSAHNAAVGGASKSRHTTGEAADIVVEGQTPRDVAKYAETRGVKGIGLYETSADGYFVHVDTRTSKAFWYGQKQAYRSTFGGSTPAAPSTSNTSPITTLRRGSNGAEVKELQENLIKLGYDLGRYGADGDYGAATQAAVRRFQEDEDLDADGIAGPITLKAIDATIAEMNTVDNTLINKKRVQITASGLNIRYGAGTMYPIVGVVYKGSTHTITDIDGEWGRIENPEGWINLSYVKEI